MLIELSCDKLIGHCQPRGVIKFNKGLNVVLGDNAGSNSIGKTTFLMLVDFAFGGNTYVEKANDVREHIGGHIIKFAFNFEGKTYYFSRDTIKNQEVNICDDTYNIQSTITLYDFCLLLKNHYGMPQQDLSFREAISRYSRIYQKDNTNERRPLSIHPAESQEKSVAALIKLFNEYTQLLEIKKQIIDCKEKISLYKLAEKHDFVPTIKNNKEYTDKGNELLRLQAEQDNLATADTLQEKTLAELQRITELKRELQNLRAQKSRVENAIVRLAENQHITQNRRFENDFSSLKSLFPNIDITSLEKIESFHSTITQIFDSELIDEIKSKEAEKTDLINIINKAEKELELFDIPSGISRKLLNEYSVRQNTINNIRQQRRYYEDFSKLKETLKKYDNQFKEFSKSILAKLQQEINHKMEELNDIVYDSQKKAPILTLSENSYNFFTPDDSGTGTLYKSLIVFDLAILSLTNLPVLIHDSVLFKNIADIPLEHILDLYQSSNKQIFIALDKASSYSEKTNNYLNTYAILHLTNNGGELFGYSWGNN